VESGLPELRLNVPCDDFADFDSRLAPHVWANGVRIATEQPLGLGTRVATALVLRSGETLRGEGIIDAHVQIDARPGVRVRLLRLEPAEQRPARPLEDELFGDLPDASSDAQLLTDEVRDASCEIAAVVNRRARWFSRAAIALIAVAAGLGAAAYVIARRGPSASPEHAVASHVEEADRLISDGRFTGEHGAIAHLLAAKRLRPDDAETNARLSRIADRLETLGARALARGDLAVASEHLAAAQLAAPGRRSIRAKLNAIAKRQRADDPPPKRKRTTTRAPSRPRTASR
jgi:hypothetical protein